MFGARKGGADGEPGQDNMARSENTTAPQARPVDAAPRMAAPAHVAPQRVVDIPRAATRRTPSGGEQLSSASSDGARTLRVGKGLSVAGEITSCDVLIVEGKVEAKLNDGKMLEITEAGQFRGSVEIENADIAGRYDGQLIVHGRLTVRSTGRVSGMVKYGELEVNAGGQIIGEIQVTGGGAGAATAPAASFKNTGKFATYDEAEEAVPATPARADRRSA